MAKPANIDIGFTHIPITRNKFDAYNCNRLTFINKGTQSVTIDGVLVLAPGDAITYPPDQPNEINRTKYNIVFTNDQQTGCLLVAVCKNIMGWGQ